MIRKPIVHRVNRRRSDPSALPSYTPVGVTSSTVTGGKGRFVFNVPIILNGTPGIKVAGTSGGAITQTATAVSVVNPTTIDLTYAVGPVTGSGYTIPINDPSIRSNTGGFLPATGGTF